MAVWVIHLLISGHDRRTAPKFGTHVRIDTVADDGFVSRAVGGSIAAFCVYVRRQRQRTSDDS